MSAAYTTTPRVQRERDLFLRLLQLGHQDDAETFLRESLDLVIDICGAHKGYLELLGAGAGAGDGWIAAGCDHAEVDGIRDSISRGIIAETIAGGRTISTASALTDPAFQDLHSVQLHRIEAVLCTPIGGERPVGILVLQGRSTPGRFSDEDQHLAELFARHLVPLVDRLRLRHDVPDDPTRPWRDRLDLDGLVGRSAAMAEVLRAVALVAPLDIDVLLTGDTGTGKTAVARAIHRNSRRSAGPLVELNCAAVPDNLLESELFGHARGSFTGATADRAGRFEAAHHGTLFLDEVAELPLPLQAKLLRAVQDRVIERVGETRSRPVDIRIVAATNRDLAAAVEAGQFRADLFYRLEVVPVRLPPLAERPDDIPLLADHLLRQFQQRHQMPPARLSPAAVVALQTATWPGNVRELTNVIQRSATFAAGEGAHTVEPRHMFPGRSDPDGGDPAGEVGFHEATRRFQRHLVQAALLATDWNVSETARRLRVARSYLYRLMDSHSMRRDEP